jgi:uncharacterized protein (PEP-CTERM system associated)
MFSGIASADSTLTVAPRITATEVYSSNRTLTGTSGDGGWITNLAPGININSSGARIKGYLDYQLNGYYYMGDSDFRDSQHQLNSFVNVEAVDNWLYVDALATIFQRQQSLFGPVAVSSGTGIGNQGESRFGQLSPYIRGRAFSFADYLVRASVIESQSDVQSVSNTRVNQLLGSLGNQATAGTIGWFGDANVTQVSNDVIGDRDNERARWGLVIPLTAQLHLSLSDGRERTNYVSDTRETTATPGIGLHWSPNVRTEFVGVRERRFFGLGHSFQFSHRTRLLALRYSDVKDVSILPTLPSGVYRGSIYDLMSDLLAASVPNPDERAIAVRARVDQIGPASSMSESGGATTSRLFLDRTRQVSAATIGVRNIVTVIVRRRDEQLLSVVAPGVADDFSLAPDLRERGATLSWLYRLTPTSDIRFASTRLKRDDYGVAGLWLDQTSNSASISFRLNPKAVTSFGLYRTRTDSSIRGLIWESAAAASLTQQF